jgi:hypothetical protein
MTMTNHGPSISYWIDVYRMITLSLCSHWTSTGVVWPATPDHSRATTVDNCETSCLTRNDAPNAVALACVAAHSEAENMRMWRGG